MLAHSIFTSPFHGSIKFVNVDYEKIGKDRSFSNNKYSYKICSSISVDCSTYGNPIIDEPMSLDNFGYVEVKKDGNNGWKICVSLNWRNGQLSF